jgi:tetratricopeptide (TPR) repeat protein
VVYRAKDITLDRSVAVKVLSRGFATSDDARARFLREARAASALDHQNIATILEFGEQDGEQFIAMPLYEGETLKERLEGGSLEVLEAARIVGQIATGLDAAHSADIIQRGPRRAGLVRRARRPASEEEHVRAKRYQDALVEIEKARVIDPDSDDCLSGTGYIYALSGRRSDAQSILEQLKKKDATKDRSGQIATIYAGLDDREHMFEWLEKAYRRRSNWLVTDLRSSFIYDPFRSDPRFADLIRRIGFPP